MPAPVQITYRNVESTDEIDSRIREEAAKLETFYDHIINLRVVVEMPHQQRQRGNPYQISIEIDIPGHNVFVNNQPSLHGSKKDVISERNRKNYENQARYKDVFVAISDAFRAARRELQENARRQRGDVKFHEPPPIARVARLFPEEGYGFIETPLGEQIYFHRNSLVNGDFDQIEVGTAVTFTEVPGEKGPQASAVKLVG